MKVILSQGDALESVCDALLIPVLGKEPVLSVCGDTSAHGARLTGMLRAWLKSTPQAGKAGAVHVLPTWETLPAKKLLLVGMGPAGRFSSVRLYEALEAAMHAAVEHSCSRITFGLPSSCEALPFAASDLLRALSWAQAAHGGGTCRVTVKSPSRPTPAYRAAVSYGAALGQAAQTVRPLADLPGNQATPDRIVKEARALARDTGLECTVWGPKELARRKSGGLLAVAAGSAHAPYMIFLRHKGNSRRRPLTLVGKTITFDTGGISLKPPKSMEWMRYDKCGGMAVLGAMSAIARIKPDIPVTGILAVAENMPDGKATRPGDVIRTLSGKTVEVINTDAEGRLVLADALAAAAMDKPEAVVDVATLTGAICVALGPSAAGLMGNNSNLQAALERAGLDSGERLWSMPLYPELVDRLSSKFADLANVAGERDAGALVAGAFLRAFVDQGTPWAHLDIAATAWRERSTAHLPAGATLFGMRLLVEWIMAEDIKQRRT